MFSAYIEMWCFLIIWFIKIIIIWVNMLEMRIIIYAGGTRAKWEREKLLTYVQKLAPIIFYFFYSHFPSTWSCRATLTILIVVIFIEITVWRSRSHISNAMEVWNLVKKSDRVMRAFEWRYTECVASNSPSARWTGSTGILISCSDIRIEPICLYSQII